MNFAGGVIIGLIAGWVIEWIIDWLFWRRGESQDSGLQDKLRRAEAEADQLRAQLDEHGVKLSDANQTIDNLRARLDALAGQVSQPEDQLERIKGIGSVFAGRLKAAGVHTFEELAALTPERVRDIIRPEEWQKIEPGSWLAQAKELADKKAATVTN